MYAEGRLPLSAESLKGLRVKTWGKHFLISFRSGLLKKDFIQASRWLTGKQKECPRCKMPADKVYIGRHKRVTCFCNHCQALFA